MAKAQLSFTHTGTEVVLGAGLVLDLGHGIGHFRTNPANHAPEREMCSAIFHVLFLARSGDS